MHLALASLAALLFTIGGIFMKRADGLRQLAPSIMFILLFAGGAVSQSQAMRGAEMGTTYVVVLGLEAALAVAFGMMLFAEPLTLRKVGAVALIVSGIALLKAP